MYLLVGECLPFVAAGLAEAVHGALCIDLAHALKYFYSGWAAVDQPVHLCLIIRMLLLSRHAFVRYTLQPNLQFCMPLTWHSSIGRTTFSI